MVCSYKTSIGSMRGFLPVFSNGVPQNQYWTTAGFLPLSQNGAPLQNQHWPIKGSSFCRNGVPHKTNIGQDRQTSVLTKIVCLYKTDIGPVWALY